MPGYANPGAGFGRGFGRGFGGGRGRRRWFRASGQPVWMGFDVNQTAAPDPEREKLALRGRLQALQAQLEAIRQRLDELDAAAGPA